MKKHLFLTVATMLALITTAGLLRAIAGQSQPQQKPFADAQFMTQAAQGGLAEVELSRLAQSKSTNERLKGVAQKIQADHEKANAELETIARSRNVELPDALDETHRALRDKLDALTGGAFDRAWAEQMVKDHQAAIDLFTKSSKSATDAEVRAFAAKQLPALRAHLKQSQDLLKAGADRRERR